MDKRERVLAAMRGEKTDRVSAGFWLHFPAEAMYGEAAVQAHEDFYRNTGVDLFKIMNENLYPCVQPISEAGDWRQVAAVKRDDKIITDQSETIKRVLERLNGETAALATIHGVVASAWHSTGLAGQYASRGGMVAQHLSEDRDAVLDALKRVAEGLCYFCEESVKAGADGVYYAHLGGERDRFTDEDYERYIKPLDQQVLAAANAVSRYNVLHICKSGIALERFQDYDAPVVNWAVHDNDLKLKDARAFFQGKVILGGLDDRSGVLVDGDQEMIEKAVFALIDEMGTQGFILGADCTLPTEIPYEKIRFAVEAAKKYTVK